MGVWNDLKAVVNSASKATCGVLNAAADSAESVSSMVKASNHVTKAMELHASEIEANAQFEVEKGQELRKKAIKDFKASLMNMEPVD